MFMVYDKTAPHALAFVGTILFGEIWVLK